MILSLIAATVIVLTVKYRDMKRAELLKDTTKITETTTAEPTTTLRAETDSDVATPSDSEAETETSRSTDTTSKNYTVVLTTKQITYKITPSDLPFAYERELIASVVMNEAGGECYEGKCAVAQCILNACIEANKKFSEVRWSYGYKYEKTPTDAVLKAVDDVFLNGVRVTDEPILFYYNPAYGYSGFHESQTFVMTIEHHRFFKKNG